MSNTEKRADDDSEIARSYNDLLVALKRIAEAPSDLLPDWYQSVARAAIANRK